MKKRILSPALTLTLCLGLAIPAVAAGVMGGTGNNQFSPAATYTKEQSIITTSRLFDLVK